MMKYLLISLMAIMLVRSETFAQDPVFSQPYLAPVYLNPAATGSGDHDLRVSGIVRRQWWGIPSAFTYSVFSIDKFIPKLQSGVGLLMTTSSEGYIKKNGLYASYAYTFCPGGPYNPAFDQTLPKWFLTGALQLGGAERHVNYNDLLFADQIDVNGITGGPTGADLAVNNSRIYLDAGAGLIFNYRFTDYKRLLLGVSARHVNRPDESLTASNNIVRSVLPVLWSANLLYTNSTSDNWTFSAGGNLSSQQQNHFMQAGIEITQNDYDITLGAWYRGGFGLSNGVPKFKDPDAITLSLSFNLSGRENRTSKIRAGIAYDSPLNNQKYSYNGGSSEFGFVWDQQTHDVNAEDPCKPVISSRLACPVNFR